MNFLVTFESLKIYKIKAEKRLQILFVVLLIVNAGIWFLPFVDLDFSAFFDVFDELVAGRMVALELSQGNLILIVLNLGAVLLNLLATFTYAALFVRESLGQDKLSLGKMYLFSLPRLLALLFLLIVPTIFSTFLLMIPLIIFLVIMYFLPINLFVHRLSLPEAMRKSFELTKGARMIIFFQVVLLSLFLTFPESLILSFMSNNFIAGILLQAFFTVYLAFAQGRLMGLTYVYLTKQDINKKINIVIPRR